MGQADVMIRVDVRCFQECFLRVLKKACCADCPFHRSDAAFPSLLLKPNSKLSPDFRDERRLDRLPSGNNGGWIHNPEISLEYLYIPPQIPLTLCSEASERLEGSDAIMDEGL